MKDKKWAQREVDRYLSYEGVNEARNALVFAKGVINQLDEPEKVVVPQFVADWIEKKRESYKSSFLSLGHDLYANNISDSEISIWMTMNQNTFARAWLDGFTEEEE